MSKTLDEKARPMSLAMHQYREVQEHMNLALAGSVTAAPELHAVMSKSQLYEDWLQGLCTTGEFLIEVELMLHGAIR